MFVPAHITGFFSIHIDREVLKTGSKGAGITLNRGVKIEIKEGRGRIYYNNKKVDICPVKKLLPENFDLFLTSPFPLASGLGMSGASALGVAKLFYNNFLEKAHTSEVLCGTGLGDVIAQYVKGFVIRLKPGLPFKVLKINVDKYVVVDVLGKMETREIIKDNIKKERINRVGERCLNELLKKPTIENFMKLSYRFALETGLMDDEIKEICKTVKNSSQSMLGKTFFCVVDRDEIKEVCSILNDPIICKVIN
ncbi:pantoate kinase [Methanocaldococcus infernus]